MLTIAQRDGAVLPEGVRRELLARATQALRRARRAGRPVLAAVTVTLDAPVDPLAVAAASRRAGEPWFSFEQPDRSSAIASIGAAAQLSAAGPGRFGEVAERWERLSAEAAADPPDGPPGSGLVATGGFAFASGGARTPEWAGFGEASLTVPEAVLARHGDETRLTLAVLAAPDDTEEALVARAAARLGELRGDPLPLLDPDPAERAQVRSVLPPEHFTAAVAAAVERIGRGELDKLVLAREVQVTAGRPHEPAALLGVLREAFPGCFTYAVGRGDAAFLGASPELLVRREGMRASTVALAGSTRRSADPAVDAHLGEQLLQSDKDRAEQAIVTRRIERTLRGHSVWVASAPEPALVKVANIQHLGTPIRAQLAHPVSALGLAGALHPTPAVGGEPAGDALALMPALEGMDRGWYAAPVGWTDAAQDGEFCVGLRCALVRGRVASLYAGVGVVAGSDPQDELAETEVKLSALLPLLS